MLPTPSVAPLFDVANGTVMVNVAPASTSSVPFRFRLPICRIAVLISTVASPPIVPTSVAAVGVFTTTRPGPVIVPPSAAVPVSVSVWPFSVSVASLPV